MNEKNYDKINPKQLDSRYKKIPREAYLKNHWYPLIENLVQKYCKDNQVLDLGCGTGRYTSLIAKNTNKTIGLDVSKNILNYAKNKNNDFDLVLANAIITPIRNESIDIVFCVGLFEYAGNENVLKEIDRILKPHGVCVIQCPNKYSMIRFFNKLISKILDKEYVVREPSYKEMSKLFKKYKYDVIEVRMDDGLIWLPNVFDKIFGKQIYIVIENFFKMFGQNPFSNGMLFVIRKS